MTQSPVAPAQSEELEVGEVKVGAVVTESRHAQTVKDALSKRHTWHKGKVTPYTSDDGSKVSRPVWMMRFGNQGGSGFSSFRGALIKSVMRVD